MAFNKYSYSDDSNPFKIHFRTHECYMCGTKLELFKHHREVSKASADYEYYKEGMRRRKASSSSGARPTFVGPTEFICKKFRCPSCEREIDCLTQQVFEDLDVCISKIERYMREKKGREIRIVKRYMCRNGELHEVPQEISTMTDIYLFLEENEQLRQMCAIPVRRRNIFHRPYFFTVKKRKLMAAVKEALDIR